MARHVTFYATLPKFKAEETKSEIRSGCFQYFENSFQNLLDIDSITVNLKSRVSHLVKLVPVIIH